MWSSKNFSPYSTPKFLLEFHTHPTHLALLVANKLSQKAHHRSGDASFADGSSNQLCLFHGQLSACIICGLCSFLWVTYSAVVFFETKPCNKYATIQRHDLKGFGIGGLYFHVICTCAQLTQWLSLCVMTCMEDLEVLVRLTVTKGF